MADVTGPISSLPGARHVPPKDMKCDDCDNPATIRVQGDTDSFGSEMFDYCAACYAKAKEELNSDYTGHCDWCKTGNLVLKPMRDYEEGQAGRVYYVCSGCRSDYNKRVAEEMAAEDFHDLDYDEPEEYNDLKDLDFDDIEPIDHVPPSNFKVFYFLNGEKYSEDVYAESPDGAAKEIRRQVKGAVIQKTKFIGAK